MLGTDNAVKVSRFFSLIEEYWSSRFEKVRYQVILLLEGTIMLAEVVDVLRKGLKVAVAHIGRNRRWHVREVCSAFQTMSAIEGDCVAQREKERGKQERAWRHCNR